MPRSRVLRVGALAAVLTCVSFGCRAFLDTSDSPDIDEAADAEPDSVAPIVDAAVDAADAAIVCPQYIPEEGNYSYQVVSVSQPGEEQLFVLMNGKEPDSSLNFTINTFPATVTHVGGGDWTFRVQLTLQHFEQYTFATAEGGLKVPQVVESLFNIPIAVNCAPAVDAIRCPMIPDATWAGAGAGTFGDGAVNASLNFTYVGIEDLPVAGALVPTYHVKEARVLLNAVSGHQENEYWYAVKDGLLIHGKITVGVIGSKMVDGVLFNFLGSDEYKASVEYQVQSLVPSPLIRDAGIDAD